MPLNRFGASPQIIGNIVTLRFAAAASDVVWPNAVVTPYPLNVNSPDQFLIRTLGSGVASVSVIDIPVASAQLEGKTFFIKLQQIVTPGDTVSVVVPVAGTIPLTALADFAQIECQDTTAVGDLVSSYGWNIVLAVSGGVWV